MATQAAGTDGIGSSGANEFAHGKGALPGQRRRSSSTTTSTAPAVDDERQRRLRRRPAGLHPRPTTRCATRASRATPTRAPSTERFPISRAPAARPTRSSTSDGKGHGLNPDHVPGRRDVHRPARRPRRRHREARSHEAQAAQGHAARSPPALLTLAVLAVVTYLGFTKAIPFKHHYTVQAVFRSANNIKPGSLVRIAGVNVGKVTGDRATSRTASRPRVVTMRIDKKGLPIHKDATFKIRPRIFLEGNFFVDVSPGSPSAPHAARRRRVPINQTSAPVQLDQVLSALQAPTRKDLQALLRELSSGLKGKGGARLQPLDPLLEARLPRRRDRRRRAAGHAARRPRALHRQAPASPPRRSTATASSSRRWSPTSTRPPARSPRASRSSRPPSASCRARCTPAMPALGALNRSFPAVRGLIRAARPGRALLGPGDRRRACPSSSRCAGSCPSPSCAASSHDLRPMVPALTDAQPALGAALRAGLAGLELPERGDPALDQGQDRGQDLPGARPGLRGGDQAAARPRRREPLGRRQRPVVPRHAHRRRSSPTRWATDKFFLTGQPLQGVNPPTPKNHARPPLRADVPCETQQPPDLRTVPDAAPQGFDLAAAVGRRQGAGAAEDRRLAAQGPQGRGLRR